MAVAIPSAMPPSFLFTVESEKRDCSPEPVEPIEPIEPVHSKPNMWERLSLHKFGSWVKRKDEDESGLGHPWEKQPCPTKPEHGPRPGFLGRRGSRKVVPGLPRPLTFRRMNSERRDRLCPHEPDGEERRAKSADRRPVSNRRTLSPPILPIPSISLPDVRNPDQDPRASGSFLGGSNNGQQKSCDARDNNGGFSGRSSGLLPPGPPRSLSTIGGLTDWDASSQGQDDRLIQQELEAKWILNLSMHFRDMSDREKFFVTYAEQPNRWRRVTVSLDYRDVAREPDSLEADLKSLHYQRDKNARIYEAIRDSLSAIKFYDTVTNLKLQTTDSRLHVHVTEDVNETIPYPQINHLGHLDCKQFLERDVNFESHISGFVYRVNVHGKTYIKKEIPGPDTVEEFLYEIECLSAVQPAKSVISFEGIIVDEKHEIIKGLLISYADQGALVDLLYDYKGSDTMLWSRRERWAKQIVEGLSEIHESGFVQGDCTLSNIVVDSKDDAKIIDINRRGCPVGWESPELAARIESGQRISIYIGVKSDLYQLGMCLWAIAEEKDEPEREERPLEFSPASEFVPQYYRDMVNALLSKNPKDRPSAKDLLDRFPTIDEDCSRPVNTQRHSVSTHRSDKEYIDPATAVDLSDIENSRLRSLHPSDLSTGDFTFADIPTSTEYQFESSGSYLVAHRSRSPRRRRSFKDSPYARPLSIPSIDDSDLDHDLESLPDTQERSRWEQIYVDGDTRLVHRGSPSIGEQYGIQSDDTDCFTTPQAEPLNPMDGRALSISSISKEHPPQAIPVQPQVTGSTLGNFSTIDVPASSSLLKEEALTFVDRGEFNEPHEPDIAPTPTNQEKKVAQEVHIEPALELAGSSMSPDPSDLVNLPRNASFHDRVQWLPEDSSLAELEKEVGTESPQRSVLVSSTPQTDLQPLEPAKADFQSAIPAKASFHERVRSLDKKSSLVELEKEISVETLPTVEPAAPAFRFSPPAHQDSGFDESMIPQVEPLYPTPKQTVESSVDDPTTSSPSRRRHMTTASKDNAAELARFVAAQFSSLAHQDSGFDELQFPDSRSWQTSIKPAREHPEHESSIAHLQPDVAENIKQLSPTVPSLTSTASVVSSATSPIMPMVRGNNNSVVTDPKISCVFPSTQSAAASGLHEPDPKSTTTAASGRLNALEPSEPTSQTLSPEKEHGAAIQARPLKDSINSTYHSTFSEPPTWSFSATPSTTNGFSKNDLHQPANS